MKKLQERKPSRLPVSRGRVVYAEAIKEGNAEMKHVNLPCLPIGRVNFLETSLVLG